jgi:hypothetical protein
MIFICTSKGKAVTGEPIISILAGFLETSNSRDEFKY